RLETPYVTGASAAHGGGGDPSPMTALGVFRGIQAALREAFGDDDPAGRTVAVQGLGSVGFRLCELLHEAGARLVVTDLRPDVVERAVRQFGADGVGPDEIFEVPCDVFAPCALGGVINDHTIPRLRCRIVAGSANNQLAEERHGAELEARGILYVPDYVINAGGVIHVADELAGYHAERVKKRVDQIYDRVAEVFSIARRAEIPTHKAADRMAEERIAVLRQIRSTYLPRA
ncbi:MAG: leucine dehydrogenase, partial [Alicyclobacillaceae bacterium]|nr:leucine dehydrogenase [Alicyclobacillaceae bacterium]